MGYTTEFRGQFDFNRELDDETYDLMVGLNQTRRMARNLASEYGIEGEFFVEGGWGVNERDPSIINYNQPPSTQPGLWLQWTPTADKLHLKWDGEEKFYHYTEWLIYLIYRILAPKGYVLNGVVQYRGDDVDDYGIITIFNNEVNQIIHGRPEDYAIPREETIEDIVNRLSED